MTALLYRFREPLPFHNLPVVFLPVRARHHPPLQVVKGNAGDLRTAQFHEQEVVSGVGIDG